MVMMPDSPLSGDINTPLGKAPKKYVIGGVIVGIGVAVIIAVRSKKQAAAVQAAASTAQTNLVTDPDGNQCAAVDPASGYCPGTAGDLAYQQQQYAALSSAEDDSGYDEYDTGGTGTTGYVTDPAGNVCTAVDPATGYCPGTSQDTAALASESGTSTTSTGTTTSTSTAPTTNSQWMTDALAVLPGGDSSANQTALASVLGGLTVTTAQQQVFLEAVGLVGDPPQGYPQPIKTSDTAATQNSTSSQKAGAVNGLTVVPSGTGIQAKWSASTNATQGYRWQLTGPQSESGNTTSLSVTIHNLKKGTYNFGIQALPGGTGNNKSVTVGLWH